MGNRTDQIWVRRQRQRKTKSDSYGEKNIEIFWPVLFTWWKKTVILVPFACIELATVIRKHLFQELKISQRHNPQCQSACKQNSGLAVTGNVSKRGNNLSGKINNDKLFSKSMNRDKKRSLSISTGSVSAACILIDASAVTDESPAVSEVKGSGGAVMGSALWLQSPTFNERYHKSKPAWEEGAKTTGGPSCDGPFSMRNSFTLNICVIWQFN